MNFVKADALITAATKRFQKKRQPWLVERQISLKYEKIGVSCIQCFLWIILRNIGVGVDIPS